MSSRRSTAAAVPTPEQGAGRRRRVGIAAATAVVLALAAAGGAFALSGGDERPADTRRAAPASPTPSAEGPTTAPSPSSSPVQAWRDGVTRDYQQLAGSSFSAVRTVTEWNLGRASAADVAGRVEVALVSSQDTVTALAARAPLPGTEQALGEYRAAADLYVQSLRTVLVATRLPAGPLQTQLRRASARVRDLGDRLFDQAGVSLAPLLPSERSFDGVEVRKPPDVPDYDAIDLGVGPPLVPTARTGGAVRTYQQKRPEQPAAAWRAALARIDPPAPAEVAALLRSGTAAQRAATAGRLVAASDALRAMPDPFGKRTVSTQVQLALLVHADALYAAQAAALLQGADRSRMTEVATSLAATATTLRALQP